MTRLGERVRDALKYLCILYLAFVIFSFSLSQMLPSFDTIRDMRDEKCYWTNAMLVFVECGSAVPASAAKELVYNFWLRLIYSPMAMFAGYLQHALWTMALYAPFVIFAAILFKKRKVRRPS
ncbi:MAG: hypothetical protein AAFV59_16660 [Pseudomonadota bacterium]